MQALIDSYCSGEQKNDMEGIYRAVVTGDVGSLDQYLSMGCSFKFSVLGDPLTFPAVVNGRLDSLKYLVSVGGVSAMDRDRRGESLLACSVGMFIRTRDLRYQEIMMYIVSIVNVHEVRYVRDRCTKGVIKDILSRCC